MLSNARPSVNIPAAIPSHYDQLRDYIARGWWLVAHHGLMTTYPAPDFQACACGDPFCGQPGKHPWRPWKGGTRPDMRRLLSLEAEHAQRTGFGSCNWAVALEPSGLCVIDADQHAGGADGVTALAALERLRGPLPPTPADNHGHRFYRLPAEFATWPTAQIYLAPGLELLGGRADATRCAHVPPSDHWRGREYRWLPGCAPWEVAVAELPPWVIDLAAQRVRDQADRDHAAGITRSHGEGARIEYRDCGAMPVVERARRYVATIPGSVQGMNGSAPCFKVACALIGKFDLSHSDAMDVMRWWNQCCSPPWSERELRHKVNDAAKRVRDRGTLLDPRGTVRFGRAWCDVGPAKIEIVATAKRRCGCGKQHCGCVPVKLPLQKCNPTAAVHSELRAATAADRIAHAFGRMSETQWARLRAEADEKTAREAAAARELAEERAAEARRGRCLNPRRPLILRNSTEVRHVVNRCKRWACPGCSHVFRRAWESAVRKHLAALIDEGRTLYVATVAPADWRRVRQRLYRDEASYFTFQPDGESAGGCRAVFAAASCATVVPGSEEVPAEAVRDRLLALMADYRGDESPMGGSHDWSLREAKDRRVDLEPFTVAGFVSSDLSADEADAIAVRAGMQPEPVSSGGRSLSTMRITRYVWPPGMSHADRDRVVGEWIRPTMIGDSEITVVPPKRSRGRDDWPDRPPPDWLPAAVWAGDLDAF